MGIANNATFAYKENVAWSSQVIIKPEEQKHIQQMFRSQKLTEEPQFDEYVDYYDLA